MAAKKEKAGKVPKQMKQNTLFRNSQKVQKLFSR